MAHLASNNTVLAILENFVGESRYGKLAYQKCNYNNVTYTRDVKIVSQILSIIKSEYSNFQLPNVLSNVT